MKFQLFLEMSELGRTVLIDSHPVIHSREVPMNAWRKAVSERLNVCNDFNSQKEGAVWLGPCQGVSDICDLSDLTSEPDIQGLSLICRHLPLLTFPSFSHSWSPNP